MATFHLAVGTVSTEEACEVYVKKSGQINPSETLYLSREGDYYLVYEDSQPNHAPAAVSVTPAAAAQWLMIAGFELPESLKPYHGESSNGGTSTQSVQ